MGDLAQALCLFCTVITGTPAPQMPQTTWDIKYRHEDLGHGKHLLRLSVDYYLVQPQSDMRRRIGIHSRRITPSRPARCATRSSTTAAATCARKT